MIFREVKIFDALIRTYVLSNYNEAYSSRRRAMVIICPGGAYRFCSEREAEPIAIRFNSMGYNSLVLYYTTNNDEKGSIYPKPQQQLAHTVKWVRENADELNTDPDKIVVLGFSAGGHLAASLGVFWQEYGEDAKPDAMVLCYPVISAGQFAHERSIRNLAGDDASLKEKMSLENQVNRATPPAFIWTTRTDQSVPYENSVMFKEALDRFGIQNELIIYPEGVHGLSLGTSETSDDRRHVVKCVQDWPLRAHLFLKKVLGSPF